MSSEPITAERGARAGENFHGGLIAKIQKTAARFDADVELEHAHRIVDAKVLTAMYALVVVRGDAITVRAVGEDAGEAVVAVAERVATPARPNGLEKREKPKPNESEGAAELRERLNELRPKKQQADDDWARLRRHLTEKAAAGDLKPDLANLVRLRALQEWRGILHKAINTTWRRLREAERKSGEQ